MPRYQPRYHWVDYTDPHSRLGTVDRGIDANGTVTNLLLCLLAAIVLPGTPYAMTQMTDLPHPTGPASLLAVVAVILASTLGYAIVLAVYTLARRVYFTRRVAPTRDILDGVLT